MNERPWRVAYLLTHPIQYQSPLIRTIAQDPAIDLTVLYQTDFSLGTFRDAEFGRDVAWDVPLLGGYRHEILERRAWPRPPAMGFGFWGPFNRGLARRLRAGRFDAL